MAYFVIDTFCDRSAAEQKAAQYRDAGRQRVELLEVNGITVNDCTEFPPTAKYVQDARPLYIILCEG